ncbi:YopX family protein [Fusobacterium nucleatum]|uniref:YopX family protein n=1 Tax=Fusobacterium nucleatum TaxID=851 RepID=UPI0030CFA25E
MREIKFRAWLKEKKEMIDNARPDFFCKHLHYLCDNSSGGQDVLGVSTEDIELMQYTGLKDKNNKEIYEGDILSDGNNDKPYKVIFENGSFRAEFEGDFEEYSFDLIDVVAQGCEIVGNIYENPELLGRQ